MPPIPTDVPMPEPMDVPVPDPKDVPPPDPGKIPNPAKPRPDEFNPKPRSAVARRSTCTSEATISTPQNPSPRPSPWPEGVIRLYSSTVSLIFFQRTSFGFALIADAVNLQRNEAGRRKRLLVVVGEIGGRHAIEPGLNAIAFGNDSK